MRYGLSRVGLETGELTDQDLLYVDTKVIQAARNALVARRIFPVVSLADAGVKTWRQYVLTDMSQASIDMDGFNESADRGQLAAKDVKVPVISKSFKLFWRDVIASRRGGMPIDTLSAENAAIQVVEEEDKLCLSGEHTGWLALGIEGLATATGRLTETGTNWATATNAITNIAESVAKLAAAQHYGPYALVVPSALAAKLSALISNTGIMAREKILQLVSQIIVTDNLFASDGGQDSALVVEPSADNFVLGVGQDIVTYNWQDKDMTIHGKVYEVATPYIKRANSIVEITGIT